MSVQAMAWAFDHSRAEGMDRFVLLAMGNYANDDGVCWPSQRTVAAKVRMPQSSVNVSLRRLVELGELAIVRQGDTRRSTVYRFTWWSGPEQNDQPRGPWPVDNPPEGDHQVITPDHSDQPRPISVISPGGSDPSITIRNHQGDQPPHKGNCHCPECTAWIEHRHGLR